MLPGLPHGVGTDIRCEDTTGGGGPSSLKSSSGPPRPLPRLPREVTQKLFSRTTRGGGQQRPGGQPSGVRLGGLPPPPSRRAPSPLPCALGPQEGWGGPASPGAAKGTESAALGRAASRAKTMWFQSNCPKILLQHKPRAIHSPATNQRQSYRINRFHTRGAGQPGARTRVPRPRPRRPGPVSCEGKDSSGRVGAPPGLLLPLTPTSLWRTELEGPALHITPVQAPVGRQGAGAKLGRQPGQPRASWGLGARESPASSLRPDPPIPRLRPWALHPFGKHLHARMRY